VFWKFLFRIENDVAIISTIHAAADQSLAMNLFLFSFLNIPAQLSVAQHGIGCAFKLTSRAHFAKNFPAISFGGVYDYCRFSAWGVFNPFLSQTFASQLTWKVLSLILSILPLPYVHIPTKTSTQIHSRPAGKLRMAWQAPRQTTN